MWLWDIVSMIEKHSQYDWKTFPYDWKTFPVRLKTFPVWLKNIPSIIEKHSQYDWKTFPVWLKNIPSIIEKTFPVWLKNIPVWLKDIPSMIEKHSQYNWKTVWFLVWSWDIPTYWTVQTQNDTLVSNQEAIVDRIITSETYISCLILCYMQAIVLYAIAHQVQVRSRLNN